MFVGGGGGGFKPNAFRSIMDWYGFSLAIASVVMIAPLRTMTLLNIIPPSFMIYYTRCSFEYHGNFLPVSFITSNGLP
jgi:hypothetical protein